LSLGNRPDGHPRLTKDRSLVDALGDQMDRASGLRIACRDGAGVRVQAGIERQKAGMDVQHPPLPAADEPRREQAHVARQGHDLDFATFKLGVQGRFVRRSILAERAMVDSDGVDPRGRRERQAPSFGAVRQDHDDLIGAAGPTSGID